MRARNGKTGEVLTCIRVADLVGCRYLEGSSCRFASTSNRYCSTLPFLTLSLLDNRILYALGCGYYYLSQLSWRNYCNAVPGLSSRTYNLEMLE
jgi:hypothetical protein